MFRRRRPGGKSRRRAADPTPPRTILAPPAQMIEEVNPFSKRLPLRFVSFWHHCHVRRCRVCSLRQADRETIESFVAGGGSLRRATFLVVARSWGISHSAIGRHVRNHVRGEKEAKPPHFLYRTPRSTSEIDKEAAASGPSSPPTGPISHDAFGNYLRLLAKFGYDPAAMARGMGQVQPRR
jgi:hypothetical protein